MATKAIPSVQQLITCPYCHETYHKPRLLPCSHSLCKRCFFSLDETDGSRRCVECGHDCSADGSSLRRDAKTEYIVRTESGRQQAQVETLSSECGIPGCAAAAAGSGVYNTIVMCQRHLQKDTEQHEILLQSVRQSYQKLKQAASLKRAALLELMTDRAEISDLFDEAMDRVQRCRQQVMEKLDAEIESLETIERSFNVTEKIADALEAAEAAGRRAESCSLCKQLQVASGDVDVEDSAGCGVRDNVGPVRRLGAAVESVATAILDDKCFQFADVSGDLEVIEIDCIRNGMSATVLSDFLCVCSNTEGYFCEGSQITKNPREDAAGMPSACAVLGLQRKSSTMPVKVAFFDMESTEFIASFSCGIAATLVSLHCSSRLQRLFLLQRSSDSHQLLVVDLAGQLIQKALIRSSVTHLAGTEDKLYCLSDNSLLCFSAETLELEICRSLEQQLQQPAGVAAVGRSLLVATADGVHRVSVVTGLVTQVWQAAEGDVVKSVAACDTGFVFVRIGGGSVKMLSSSGQLLMKHRFRESGKYKAISLCCHSAQWPRIPVFYSY